MSKIKVGLDISRMNPLSLNRGIGYYTRNLFESLKNISNLEVLLIEDQNQIREDLDLIHYPFFDFFSSTLPLKKSSPTIVTIHDVTPLVFPKHYPAGIKGRINLERQKLSLRSVKAVITDSLSSKFDIKKTLKVAEDKIFPIYLAPAKKFKSIDDQQRLKLVKIKYDLPESFALFVGNINWNKNLLNLTEGCLDSGTDLVLVGSAFGTRNSLSHPELASFKLWLEKYSTNPKVHILDNYPEDEIVEIYNIANVLLLLSFYEGFGLTILEAQACGTPVITSNTSSMPEVAGEGAALVDPENVNEISSAIESIISNKSLKENFMKRGFKNIKRFSWDKTALLTAEVYERVLNS